MLLLYSLMLSVCRGELHVSIGPSKGIEYSNVKIRPFKCASPNPFAATSMVLLLLGSSLRHLSGFRLTQVAVIVLVLCTRRGILLLAESHLLNRRSLLFGKIQCS